MQIFATPLRRTRAWSKFLTVSACGLAAMTAPIQAVHAVHADDNGRAPESRAAGFLAAFKTIRVATVRAPGNGHQAAAVTVIKKMRALGYDGRIELYYPPDTAAKLTYLLPPFRPGRATQFVPGPDVEAIESTRERPGRGRFAIEIGENPMPGETSNCDYALLLPPPNWKDHAELITPSGREFLSDVRTHFPLRRDAPPPDAFDHQLHDHHAHCPKLREKIPNLRTIAHLARWGAIDLWSAYGVGVDGPAKINLLVEAARRARRTRPDLFPRPVVMAIFSNLNEAERNEVRARIGRLATLAIEKDEFGIKFPLDAPVGVAFVGHVAQDPWHAFMDRSALPPLAAGANAVDFLTQRGRPFILTHGALLRETEGQIDGSMEDVLDRTLWDLQNGRIDALANFLIESREPRSRLRAIFEVAGQKARARPDRLCAALLATERVMADGGEDYGGFDL